MRFPKNPCFLSDCLSASKESQFGTSIESLCTVRKTQKNVVYNPGTLQYRVGTSRHGRETHSYHGPVSIFRQSAAEAIE